uniref:tetraspanin-19 n=1 Tax=Erigeron canadensis TaxID=72917 RepID=UPI001CB89931|nr:tetraspanin-19 [Erigeron canadensis]
MTTIMVVRSCMKSSLKLVNSLFGMCGIAMIVYAAWMIKIWPVSNPHCHSASWFMYTILGFGALVCAITCFGHIAAETANGCCLYCYLVFIFSLLMLEGAVTIDVFLNPNWEKDFPQDQSGNLRELRDFIRNNIDFCKWVGLSILSVEALSVFLALILIAVGPHKKVYDCDDECTPERVPLLKCYSNSNESPYVNMRPIDSSITRHF